MIDRDIMMMGLAVRGLHVSIFEVGFFPKLQNACSQANTYSASAYSYSTYPRFKNKGSLLFDLSKTKYRTCSGSHRGPLDNMMSGTAWS